MSDTQFADLRAIRYIVPRSGTNGLVRPSSIATVEQATTPRWIRVTADGRDAVLVQVSQQRGGNTVRIASETKAELARLRTRIPSDVTIANWYDQSQLIVAASRAPQGWTATQVASMVASSLRVEHHKDGPLRRLRRWSSRCEAGSLGKPPDWL